MAVDLSQFHKVFFEESFEGLQIMERCLLDLDCSAPDPEFINSIFRAAHSIKGSSATFGFSSVAHFTHLLETLLDEWRDGRRAVIQAHVDVLLQSVDVMRALLDALQQGQTPDPALSEPLTQEINRILALDASVPVLAPSSATVSASDVATPVKWNIQFTPAPGMLQSGNEPVRMFRELAELGSLVATPGISRLPEFAALDPEACYLEWQLELLSNEDEARIREIFEWVIDDCELTLTRDVTAPVAAPSEPVTVIETPNPVVGEAVTDDVHPVADHPARGAVLHADDHGRDKVRNSESSSVRVSIEKIDSLVNLVGELVITQSMLGQMTSDFDMNKLAKLQEGLAQLEHNTRELQESVMRIRMLPISFTFSRFPRMVRDLSRQLGKKVDIRISGEQTELDKTVMEKIGDPLVHLIRNSLDHGLEMPEERIAQGKSETGIITLNAYHQSGSIIIEIADDGRGLDTEKILKKAIAQKLVRETDTVTDTDIQEMIFMPGFSTADKLSDLSGRGVGMDVVRRNIEGLGGTIDVFSSPGKGLRFLIRLPLTLAILDGQLIQVGEQIYIIPLTSIVESLQPDVKLVNHVAGGCDLLRLRNEYIPIIRLHEVFDVQPCSTDLGKSLLVVVEAGADKVAIVVDELLGQQQVVIKSMEANYRKVEGVSGATILGDGTVSLILEIIDLVKMAGVQHQAKSSSKRFRNRNQVA